MACVLCIEPAQIVLFIGTLFLSNRIPFASATSTGLGWFLVLIIGVATGILFRAAWQELLQALPGTVFISSQPMEMFSNSCAPCPSVSARCAATGMQDVLSLEYILHRARRALLECAQPNHDFRESEFDADRGDVSLEQWGTLAFILLSTSVCDL